MDAATLLLLIKSWRDGDCQPEVLLDAISEYGIDVDEPPRKSGYLAWHRTNYDTIRIHIMGDSRISSCSDDHVLRHECMAARAIESKLISQQ